MGAVADVADDEMLMLVMEKSVQEDLHAGAEEAAWFLSGAGGADEFVVVVPVGRRGHEG